MAQAVVDPGELRRFASGLKRFSAELQHGMTIMHGQLLSLGDTWRDQEHLKFVEEFEQAMKSIERFLQATEQHIPFLNRKAERIEDYLQQK
jgi:hypothetical protein